MAVVGGVVVAVRTGNEAGRAVGLGEVRERPHRVADGRDVRLRDREELVVGVDRLRDLAGRIVIELSDEMRHPGSSTCSTIGRTFGCTGTRSQTRPSASRL